MAIELQNTVSAPLAAADSNKVSEVSQSSIVTNWWKLMKFKIGIIPLPVYILLFGIIAAFV